MSRIKEFEGELKKKNLGGLWETIRGEAYKEPESSFEPHVWPWKEVYGAVEQAGHLIGIEEAFRRVIQLCHPALGRATSRTLQLNVQLLKPGEHAPAHRHTLGAIRFIIAGKGAHCVVEGESFEIGEGDFITTPSWTWHDHVGDADDELIWLDGLDGPLVRHLEVGFWEPCKEKSQPVSKPSGTSALALGQLRPSWAAPGSSMQPPPYCYRWGDTERALKGLAESPADPYDGVLLHYVNPVSGGPTLPTFSCGVQMLRPGEKTKSHRHTSTSIYHVFRGSGRTVVDGRTLEWRKGDSFVVPVWRGHRHENPGTGEAILFVMSDRPLMDALGFYREQAGG